MAEQEITLDHLHTVIQNINGDIVDQTDGVEYFQVTLSSSGDNYWIEFLGLPIWDWDNDDRDYLTDSDGEDTDERVDIEAHIRKEINKQLGKLLTLKF